MTQFTVQPKPTHPRFKDLSGQRFGRLLVCDYLGTTRRGAVWRCNCDCGISVMARSVDLSSGNTASCGCVRFEKLISRNTTHGQYDSPEYRSWWKMIERCRNPAVESYPHYGGRGIKVCERWSDFANFIADMGSMPTKLHTIDRKNNSGDYCPENCRWATKQEQARNRRTNHIIEWNGESLCIADWADRIGINAKTIQDRLANGWSVERVLTEPPRKRGRQ